MFTFQMKTCTKSKNHQKKQEKSKLLHRIDLIIIASFRVS